MQTLAAAAVGGKPGGEEKERFNLIKEQEASCSSKRKISDYKGNHGGGPLSSFHLHVAQPPAFQLHYPWLGLWFSITSKGRSVELQITPPYPQAATQLNKSPNAVPPLTERNTP